MRILGHGALRRDFGSNIVKIISSVVLTVVRRNHAFLTSMSCSTVERNPVHPGTVYKARMFHKRAQSFPYRSLVYSLGN